MPTCCVRCHRWQLGLTVRCKRWTQHAGCAGHRNRPARTPSVTNGRMFRQAVDALHPPHLCREIRVSSLPRCRSRSACGVGLPDGEVGIVPKEGGPVWPQSARSLEAEGWNCCSTPSRDSRDDREQKNLGRLSRGTGPRASRVHRVDLLDRRLYSRRPRPARPPHACSPGRSASPADEGRTHLPWVSHAIAPIETRRLFKFEVSWKTSTTPRRTRLDSGAGDLGRRCHRPLAARSGRDGLKMWIRDAIDTTDERLRN